MSDTSIITLTDSKLSNITWLDSSPGKLQSPRKVHAELSKVYKQTSNFFLTRRFLDALAAIEPVVSRQAIASSNEQAEILPATIAIAEKKWRVKIWSLYLTLINSIADLGLDDGSAAFGKQRWRSIKSKAEGGSIWDDVVDVGYNGNESDMDAEVVANLANLLLAQSPDQRNNQSHLELHISLSNTVDKFSCDTPDTHDPQNDQSGRVTDVLRGIETQLQILEIYTLHVLPRNGEWDYAKDFISMSSILDDERKDAFLQTLIEMREDALAIPDRTGFDSGHYDTHWRTSSTSQDLGRTDSEITVIPAPHSSRLTDTDTQQPTHTDGSDSSPISPLRPISPKPSRIARTTFPEHSFDTTQPVSQNTTSLHSNTPRSRQSDLIKRSLYMMTMLQKLVSHSILKLSHNPTTLLRLIIFLIGFIVTFTRQDLREQVRKIIGRSWDRVRRTVGMGVKVSYI